MITPIIHIDVLQTQIDVLCHQLLLIILFLVLIKYGFFINIMKYVSIIYFSDSHIHSVYSAFILLKYIIANSCRTHSVMYLFRILKPEKFTRLN